TTGLIDDLDADDDGLLDDVETGTGTYNGPSDTGTSSTNRDSDGDNWDDGTEVALGSDPTDDEDSPGVGGGKLLAPDGDAGDAFGDAVAFVEGPDVELALVGAPGDDNARGSAYLFFRGSSPGNITWSYVEKIVAPDAAEGKRFGVAVDLVCSDATGSGLYTVIVGAQEDSAYVFTRGGNEADQATFKQKLGGGGATDFFAEAVALSASGDTAIVGAQGSTPSGIPQSGSARVYSRDAASGDWSVPVEGEALQAPNTTSNTGFGVSVDLSDSGDTAIVGSYAFEGVRVFARDVQQGTWAPQDDLAPSTASEGFGRAVALDALGDTALVGAEGHVTTAGEGGGAAWVFTRDGESGSGTWSESATLLVDDSAAYDHLGNAVALSSSGGLAAIGAYGRDDSSAGYGDTGAAYFFTKVTDGTWINRQELLAPDRAANDRLGSVVEASGTAGTLLIGAPWDDTADGQAAGSVYLFLNPDQDGDDIVNIHDNCPEHANPSQTDYDLDGEGDLCDLDDVSEVPIELVGTDGNGNSFALRAPTLGAGQPVWLS
ncbi:MAG: FG-GAP repeat protein, partial [Vicinamibacterales bacterium]|nr:FG-GAP repeat protein [Vicinamibacterales bacterium]